MMDGLTQCLVPQGASTAKPRKTDMTLFNSQPAQTLMTSGPTLVYRVLMLCTLFVSLPVPAAPHAHHHGVVRLDIAVDGPALTVQLEAPLDSLLGFEHRPRTPAQRQAADAVLKQMNDGASLVRPDAAAQCTLAKTTVGADALQPTPPLGTKDSEHADLDASFEFECRQPGQLKAIEIGLFDAFKRIRRIEVQLAGPQGQSKQMLKRPEKRVKVGR